MVVQLASTLVFRVGAPSTCTWMVAPGSVQEPFIVKVAPTIDPAWTVPLFGPVMHPSPSSTHTPTALLSEITKLPPPVLAPQRRNGDRPDPWPGVQPDPDPEPG